MSTASRPPAADFSLPATGATTVSLRTLRGKPFVLYFYPKDNTPGCTTETAAFRDHHEAFAAFEKGIEEFQ